MALAIFDLDNTLLAGDSDHLWGSFLVAEGVVDGAEFASANDRFYREYCEGTLNIDEFLRFALRPLRDNPLSRLEALRSRFIVELIEPRLLPAAHALIEKHRSAGDTLLIITASNAFITTPIAAHFGINHLIATLPAHQNGRYTGEVEGIPAFRTGKVQRLKMWLETHQHDVTGSTFYSDSHNDLPLLEWVENPIAVDPDPLLSETATARKWPILSLRNGYNQP